jgi:hypothetical protein
VNDRNIEPTTEQSPDTKRTAYDIAQRIAMHMTGSNPWIAKRRVEGDELPQAADLVRAVDGAAISLYLGGYRNEGRVTFRATWPKYRDGQSYTPRTYFAITCSAERAPKALAREIERRLLVDYEPAYRTALEHVRASDGAATDAWTAAERIAQAIGAELPSETRRGRPRTGEAVELYGGPAGVYRLRVHPAYSEGAISVSFEVHDLDVDTTLRVMALLNARGHKEG